MDAPNRRRRKPKTPLGLWVVEGRESQPTPDGKGWTSSELARRLGVSDSTVRGWEAGRTISADNLALLERLFGSVAPIETPPGQVGQAALVTAIGELVSQLATLAGLATERDDRIAAVEAVSQSNSELIGRLLEQVLQAETRLSALERTAE